MAKHKIVVEKVWKAPVRVITNLKEESEYPKWLTYDTLDDEDAYYMCNHGHPKGHPYQGVH